MEERLDPQSVCRALLSALDAHEGRRRKRKRNTTPDSIGIGIKRELLERAVRDAPSAGELEAWLARQVDELGPAYGPGAVRAMALDILNEWRFAETAPSFREWLEHGAPSADSEG
jgi:hypothetical protein